jgi:hypothetical protein
MPENIADERKGLYSGEWRRSSRSFTTLRRVPGVEFRPELPKPYVHQEYPKWIGDVLVHSAAEEAALTTAAELVKENPAPNG